MDKKIGVLDRALQIAKSGSVAKISQVRARLLDEGFKTLHRLDSRSVRLQLRAAMRSAHMRQANAQP